MNNNKYPRIQSKDRDRHIHVFTYLRNCHIDSIEHMNDTDKEKSLEEFEDFLRSMNMRELETELTRFSKLHPEHQKDYDEWFDDEDEEQDNESIAEREIRRYNKIMFDQIVRNGMDKNELQELIDGYDDDIFTQQYILNSFLKD